MNTFTRGKIATDLRANTNLTFSGLGQVLQLKGSKKNLPLVHYNSREPFAEVKGPTE
jgi:hypothetical protein